MLTSWQAGSNPAKRDPFPQTQRGRKQRAAPSRARENRGKFRNARDSGRDDASGRLLRRRKSAEPAIAFASECALALIFLTALAAGVQAANSADARHAAQTNSAAARIDEHTIHDALCSVVYQVDHTPGPRGYRYIFYGNAFFINDGGYLLTAAHVLDQFHGGQVSVLLRSPKAGPHFVQASIVAQDPAHDVAILLATPNPFAVNDSVAFLPLDDERAKPGTKVLVAALRPVRPRDAWTGDAAFEEREPGEVLRFESSRLEKGAGESELFLFSYDVRRGQSGAPVISMDTGAVAGLVEGDWLRDEPAAIAPPKSENSSGGPSSRAVGVPGAAVPIHYAIALLRAKGIAWQEASGDGSDRPH
jgi:hypothetical protein